MADLSIAKFTLMVIFLNGLQQRVECIPLNEFFQFGQDANDFKFPPADDIAGQLNLTVDFVFFNKTFRTVFANTNGILSFGVPPEASYTPTKFPLSDGVPIVAPFWADVDTRGTGEIWVRESSTDTVAIEKVKAIVANAFTGVPEFTASEVIIQTWDHVGYYNRKTNKTNTFQSVIASNGSSTFVIFLYADDGINWTTGDFHSGMNGIAGPDGLPAQVGFDAGDSTNYYSVEGSFTNDIINVDKDSNVGIPGLFVFQVNQPEIIVPQPFCPVIGSDDCNQRIKQVACMYIGNTGGAIPEPCREILDNNVM